MGGQIRFVEPGSTAEAHLADAIDQAQSADRLAPVWVVVRSPVVALDLRRRLAGRRPMAGARFTPLSRLIELLGAPALSGTGTDSRPLDPAALGAAIRVSLGGGVGLLSQVADHPATEESVSRAYRMLRAVPGPERAAIAACSRRASEVVALVDKVHDLLAPSYYDLEDLAEAAARSLLDGSSEVTEIGVVLVYLPDPMAGSEVLLLRALAQRTEVVVLLGETGDDVADRGAWKLARQLLAAGFDQPLESPESPAGSVRRFTRVIGAPDGEEEVRLALRLLMAEAEGGGQLGRCALAYPSGVREARWYRSMIEEQFHLAGVPLSHPTGRHLSEQSEALALRTFVELATASEPRFERGAVLALLGAGVTPRSSICAGLQTVELRDELPIGTFDRCSRAAGVVAHVDEWRLRLGSYARRLSRAHPSDLGAASEDLGRLVGRLVALSDRLESAETWKEVAECLSHVASSLLPPSDRQVQVADAVGGLGLLSGLERLAPPRTPERGRQIISGLESALRRTSGGEGRFGIGPVVGSIQELAALRCDLVVVLGLAEGVVPARTPEDPLVTDLERQAARALADVEGTEERDRRTLTTLLAGATESVALFARVDRGAGRLAYPSRWLLGDLYRGSIEEIASYAGALAGVANGRFAAADAGDLEMAVLRHGISAGARPAELFVAELGELAERYRREAEREQPLSRYSGSIGPIGGEEAVFGEVMSATSMERLALCPLQFFFGRLLRMSVLDAPERRHTIDPRERGTLIHSVLEDFVSRAALGKSDSVAGASTTEIRGDEATFLGWGSAHLELVETLARQYCDEYEQRGLTGKAVYWASERAQIIRDLVRYVRLDGQWMKQANEVPIAVEMSFGSEPAEPVVITAGGREMRFRGTIDRIDRSSTGALRVIDYKSGKAGSFNQISKNSLGGGRHLQLPIYAKAAQSLRTTDDAVTAEYRFCSSVAGFKRVEVTLTSELESEMEDVLAVLCTTVGSGTLPPCPGKNDEHCRRCDFEASCRLDRGAAWRRAAGSAAMAPYVALVEAGR